MKCKCKTFAGNQNQSYRSVIKTLLLKEQTWGWSKHVRPRWMFSFIRANW